MGKGLIRFLASTGLLAVVVAVAVPFAMGWGVSLPKAVDLTPVQKEISDVLSSRLFRYERSQIDAKRNAKKPVKASVPSEVRVDVSSPVLGNQAAMDQDAEQALKEKLEIYIRQNRYLRDRLSEMRNEPIKNMGSARSASELVKENQRLKRDLQRAREKTIAFEKEALSSEVDASERDFLQGEVARLRKEIELLRDGRNVEVVADETTKEELAIKGREIERLRETVNRLSKQVIKGTDNRLSLSKKVTELEEDMASSGTKLRSLRDQLEDSGEANRTCEMLLEKERVVAEKARELRQQKVSLQSELRLTKKMLETLKQASPPSRSDVQESRLVRDRIEEDSAEVSLDAPRVKKVRSELASRVAARKRKAASERSVRASSLAPESGLSARSYGTAYEKEKYVTTIKSKVNLRIGPGKEHSPNMQVPKGVKLLVEQKLGEWYRVIAPTGQRLYVSEAVVREHSPAASSVPRSWKKAPKKPVKKVRQSASSSRPAASSRSAIVSQKTTVTRRTTVSRPASSAAAPKSSKNIVRTRIPRQQQQVNALSEGDVVNLENAAMQRLRLLQSRKNSTPVAAP